VHGFITVPEEPGNAQSPQLKIFYYHPRDLLGKVTLFSNGGPGSSSHSSLPLVQTAKRFPAWATKVFIRRSRFCAISSTDHTLLHAAWLDRT
jgi:hypothetical protein